MDPVRLAVYWAQRTNRARLRTYTYVVAGEYVRCTKQKNRDFGEMSEAIEDFTICTRAWLSQKILRIRIINYLLRNHAYTANNLRTKIKWIA